MHSVLQQYCYGNIVTVKFCRRAVVTLNSLMPVEVILEYTSHFSFKAEGGESFYRTENKFICIYHALMHLLSFLFYNFNTILHRGNANSHIHPSLFTFNMYMAVELE